MTQRLAAYAIKDFKVEDRSVSVIVCALDISDAQKAADMIESAEAERDGLRRQLEQAQQALRTIEDQAGRAALVQDRSVSVIKQTCKIIADKAKAAMTA